ncbi:unnamed protein product [Rhizophagus irregularis]|nr:unnamed protein product [Rhizophagus irregularis]
MGFEINIKSKLIKESVKGNDSTSDGFVDSANLCITHLLRGFLIVFGVSNTTQTSLTHFSAALFSFRLSLGLPSLCLGLLFIRSTFRPFFFSSLFGFIFSPSWSSLFFFTSSFHTNSVLPGTLYHRSTR